VRCELDSRVRGRPKNRVQMTPLPNKENALEYHMAQETGQQQVAPQRSETGGDRDGLNNVFGSQRQRLLGAAMRLLGNAEDAEDAVQEGIMSALRNLHRFEGRSQLSTWLTRIVVNAALMRLRSVRAHESESIDALAMQHGFDRFSDMLVDGCPNPEEVCARREQRRILNQGLQGLSMSQRRALSLHDLQGMSTQEAAEELGLPVGTVKSQIHRARRKLSEQVRSIQKVRVFSEPARAA
jgi:RNA polymerase sigma-70 factor, ECF subfamily